MLTWGSGWWKRVAEVITAQVNQTIGTKLKVEVNEANTVFARLKSRDYQCSVWGWPGMIDPDEYSYDLLHTKGWRNFAYYSNPKLDALLTEARQELDPAKRGQMYRESVALDRGHAHPALLLFQCANLLAQNVSGFTQLPYSNFGDQFATLDITAS